MALFPPFPSFRVTTPRLVFYILAIMVFVLAGKFAATLGQTRHVLGEIAPLWLLLAIMAQAATYVCNALIFMVILGSDKGTLTLRSMVAIAVVTMFVNQTLPSGGISGNAYILNTLTKRGISHARAFATVVYELLCFYSTYVVLIIAALCWYVLAYHSAASVPHYVLYVGLGLYSFLMGIMYLVSHKRHMHGILLRISRIGFIARIVERTRPAVVTDTHPSGWQRFTSQPQKSVLAGLLQLGVFFFDALSVVAIIRGFNLTLPFLLVCFGLLLSLIVGALPLSPGSLVIYESAMTYFYTLLGLPVAAAILVTLVFRFVSFWLPLPVGLILYRHMEQQRKQKFTAP